MRQVGMSALSRDLFLSPIVPQYAKSAQAAIGGHAWQALVIDRKESDRRFYRIMG